MRFIIIAIAAIAGLTLLGWLTFANSEESASITIDKAEVQKDTEEAVDETQETFDKAKEETQEAYREAKEETKEALDTTGEALEDVKEETKDTLNDVKEEFDSEDAKETSTEETKEKVSSNS